MLSQSTPVIWSRVAFIACEVVLRENFMPLLEACIAMNLRDD
jgi:hypothetical protein